ncbi:hypothetical protein HY087_00465 [Candidatus Gottesmanbacteria bacterium]|nr:hypothetical protein [Candidatus Gottesmanbacteria bacterium]
MKYPSVFFSVVFVWLVVDSVAMAIARRSLTYELYIAAIVFSVVMFLIGFWRNK